MRLFSVMCCNDDHLPLLVLEELADALALLLEPPEPQPLPYADAIACEAACPAAELIAAAEACAAQAWLWLTFDLACTITKNCRIVTHCAILVHTNI